MTVRSSFVFGFCLIGTNFLLLTPRNHAAQFTKRFTPSRETTLSSLCDSLTPPQCTCPTNQTADDNVTVNNEDMALQRRFGDGYDGKLVVPSHESRIVNYYATVEGHNPKGSRSISVSDTKMFRVGREVCVMQMKGSNAGASIFAGVTAKDKTNLTLNVELTFICSTSGSVDRCQVVTVPHFTTVTLEAEATLTGMRWNGKVGGVIVFRAKEKVDVGPYESKITACGLGFKGGLGGKFLRSYGFQGESYNGVQTTTSFRNYGGGGGGLYCSDGGFGGAGGGHLFEGYESASCHYSQSSEGGLSYVSSSTEYLLMGSGGGGGGFGLRCCGRPGRGGNGGGIIIISTLALTGNGGTITACGIRGQGSSRGFNKTGGVHGAGGGGSGGSVLIMTPVSITSGLVNVDVEGGPSGTSELSSDNAGGRGSQGQKTTVNTALSGPTSSFWI